MAEVVGLVSAGVGIAAFALQLASTINKLHQICTLKPCEVTKDLHSLSKKLQILHQFVLSLKPWEGCPPVDAMINHVQSQYGDIELALEELLAKFGEENVDHRQRWKRIKLVLSSHAKQIERIRQDINDITASLTLVCCFVAPGQSPLIQNPRGTAPTDTSAFQAQEGHPIEADGETVEVSPEVVTGARFLPPPERRIISSISKKRAPFRGVRHCDASCHLTTHLSGRFWSLQYTPPAILARKTEGERSECRRIGVNLRLALSRYGIPIAIMAGLEYMVDGRGFALQPALTVQKIVRYTSPGFETIWRLEEGLINFPEARERLLQMYRSDQSLKDHRDPAGNSYIQKIVRYPWLLRKKDQFNLLHLFVSEFDATFADETQTFLTRCASWIGEGWRLDLLQSILEYGFDAAAIHPPVFEEWPVACSPDWDSVEFTPDPFFVEYVGILLKHNPDFPGSTPLHNALLNETFESARSWVHGSQALERNVNFLGQTPLHIATTSPELCRLVLDAGHDPDVNDKWGATPLMYAAAMGQTEVAKLLLSWGARPLLRDTQLNWCFFDYAFCRDHWNLAMDALLHIKSQYESDEFQLIVRFVIMRAISRDLPLSQLRDRFLLRIIKLADDINFTIKDDSEGVEDNNLMHYASSLEMASTLVQCGFDRFNQRNSKGHLAINSLSRHCTASLVNLYLENGTDVNNVGQDGRTVLFDLLSTLVQGGINNWLRWDIMDAINLCLDAGINVFTADGCICPCSPSGCHISSAFELDFPSNPWLSHAPGPVWAFEFITLIEEYRGKEDAKAMLLAFCQRLMCDDPDISIAHVCCHRGKGTIRRSLFCEKSERLQDDDIWEILDEEKDFIETLEEEVQKLSSLPFNKLRTKLMVILKEKYDARLGREKNERAEDTFNSGPKRMIIHKVDYKNDRYCINLSRTPPSFVTSASRAIAKYAFWMQHESSRTHPYPFRNSREAGWFDRRLSWLVEFMSVMEITPEILANEMRYISIKETRTEKVDANLTTKKFFEALERAGIDDEHSCA
ncbi:hypothetical protein B0T10DRAFT_537419 [Thelonectria olida]|uniref:Uncharacterized protein n=1 Tax=Thelonectria olida TaxID=1576542 RepID=A0A9P8W840_9HYPO|nr:hypothetical protein B0T10DRAFT_537419 [Thelonectria olida]